MVIEASLIGIYIRYHRDVGANLVHLHYVPRAKTTGTPTEET